MNRVKEIRLSRNISQQTLAKNLKITPSYLNKIEAGSKNLSRKLASRIAKELDCSVEEIFLQ